ncbi:MAG: DUF6318 family protein [Nocardioides sp.]
MLLRLAAGACAVVLVAGCTSNAEPSPLPEPSASSSATASPSAAPPTMPPEAEGTSPKAAKAFVRYWVGTLNYAGSSGDTSALTESSDGGCAECQSVIRTIVETHAAGGSFEGDGWSVETMKYQPLQSRARPVLTVGMKISPQLVTESEGAEPKTFEGGNRSMTFRLVSRFGHWSVVQLEQSA